MKTRKVGLIITILITLIVLGGCNSNSNDNYDTKSFQGIEYKVPKEWGITSQEDSKAVAYSFKYKNNGPVIFSVQSYPIENYSTRFVNDEGNTYKSIYSLKSVEKLSLNKELLLFKFQPQPGQKVVGELSNTEIRIMIVKLKDRILEATWDISDEYYHDHKDVIQYMLDSIEISKEEND
jgi:hypothetical protein